MISATSADSNAEIAITPAVNGWNCTPINWLEPKNTK